MGERKKIIFSRLVTKHPQTWRGLSRNIALNNEVGLFTRKSKEYFFTLAITVIGMTTALTWSDFVRGVIDIFFADRGALYVKLYVALIATAFALIVTYTMSRIKENGRD